MNRVSAKLRKLGLREETIGYSRQSRNAIQNACNRPKKP